ncbi:hypothetical protein [Paenibacillus solani]|nr:hypothetical protein [Paenibacillus solani]
MNKALLILVAVGTLLTACNSNQANNSNDVQADQQSVQTQVKQDDKEPVKEETNQEDKEPTTENTNHNQWSTLPEYNTIMQNIDLKDVTFTTVTDNEGKRILLLSDENGREKYKSIFVKKTNRLKIINIDGEGQIFNDVLKSE